MHCKPARQAVAGTVRGPPCAVGPRVGLAQTLNFGLIAQRVDRRIGLLGLAPKDMHLNKVDLGDGLTDAGIAQPFLPALKYERNLAIWIHRDQLVQTQHAFGRIAAGEPGEVDAQIAIGFALGDKRGKHRRVTLAVVGQFAASQDIECHAPKYGTRAQKRPRRVHEQPVLKCGSFGMINPASGRQTLHAGVALTQTGVLRDASIVIDGGRISAIEDGFSAPANGEAVIDARDGIVTPGLIDIQVNGALGHSFQAHDIAHFDEVLDFHVSRGATTILPTLITAPEDTLCASLRALAAAVARAGLPGIHLEGPFLAPAKSGAHDPDALRLPNSALLQRLLDAATHDGVCTIRMLTLAPELPGSTVLIQELARRGIVVCAGHSAATYDQMRIAVDAGLSFVTHAGNASDWPHRAENALGFMGSEPGVVGAFLAIDALAGAVIMDGFHQHAALLQPLLRAKGRDRLSLTSDASTVAGCPPGDYASGGISARVDARGFARSLRGGNWLAGSTITLRDAVQNAVRLSGLAFSDAIALATGTPARVLGLADKGMIAPGAVADLLVWSRAHELTLVIRGGRRVAPAL